MKEVTNQVQFMYGETHWSWRGQLFGDVSNTERINKLFNLVEAFINSHDDGVAAIMS